LEFGCIGASFFRQVDELFCALDIPIVVGGDIGNKIRWLVGADGVVSNLNLHGFLFSIWHLF
jgi:hypothetical protein